jgi:hypothetical protein
MCEAFVHKKETVMTGNASGGTWTISTCITPAKGCPVFRSHSGSSTDALRRRRGRPWGRVQTWSMSGYGIEANRPAPPPWPPRARPGVRCRLCGRSGKEKRICDGQHLSPRAIAVEPPRGLSLAVALKPRSATSPSVPLARERWLPKPCRPVLHATGSVGVSTEQDAKRSRLGLGPSCGFVNLLHGAARHAQAISVASHCTVFFRCPQQ